MSIYRQSICHIDISNRARQGGRKARQGFRKTSSQPRLLEPPSQEEAASQRGNPEKRGRFVKTGWMRPSYPVYQCGHLVQVCDLIEVLCLDLDPRRAHSTRRLTRGTHQQLVHWRGRMYFQLIWWRDVTNDVVTVDANLGQLLNQPFRLVQAAMDNNLSHQIGMS